MKSLWISVICSALTVMPVIAEVSDLSSVTINSAGGSYSCYLEVKPVIEFENEKIIVKAENQDAYEFEISDVESIIHDIKPAAGIDKNVAEKDWNVDIFPTHIEIGSRNGKPITVRLVSASGEIVYSCESGQSGVTTIATGNLAPGVYVLVINDSASCKIAVS